MVTAVVSRPRRTAIEGLPTDTEGLPDWRRDLPGARASDEPCGLDSRPFRLVPGEPWAGLTDGVRGVAEAYETVNLEAPGSTPAEHPCYRFLGKKCAATLLRSARSPDPAGRPTEGLPPDRA